MIHPAPERIIFCYAEWQDLYDEMENVEFYKGLDESLVSSENLQGKNTFLIMDDISDSVDEKFIAALYSRFSHHRAISVAFLINNLFFRGLKNMRDVSLNTHYFLLQRSFRDQSAVAAMARQMFSQSYKRMVQAYADICTKPYGYLLVDCRPSADDSIRLRTNIFPGEVTVCYIEKKNGKA